ncbi:MAG: Ig-like domain-containing protein, partial [Ruminococcus sp.]|nr:Ig-like domain-containing protein [Ruminococcus sp.]
KISADVNSDGKIDASDASLILVYYSYVSTGGTITNMKDYLESLAGNPPTTTTAPVTSTTTNPSSVTTVSATGSGRVSDIRVSRTEMSINTGEGEIAAYVTMLPASAKNKNEIWTSSNTNIATVDGEGWVTGISAGTCTVTVKSADNPDVYSEIKITVIDNKNVSDIRLNRTQMTVKVGYGEIAAYVTMLPASAIDKSEEWTSSNPEIATVDSQGWVTGKKAGTAKITVRSVNNPAVFGTVLVTVVDENTVVTTVSTQTTATNTSTVSANTTTSTADVPIEMIQVGENNITLSKNAQKQISYRVVPSSASDKPLKWTSDNESVATVDNNGIVTGIGEGTAVITVSSADNPNIHTNITVTVTKSAGTVTGIELSKYEMKLKVGGKDIAWVSMYPPEATNKNERWTSSNPDIAKVDRFGWVTGISEGECTVTVRSEDNPEISASIKVIVTNGEIDITPTVPDFSALKDGLSTDTHLAFATPVPADAKGQFAVEYLITDLNGKTSAITIPSVTVPDSKYFVGMLTADTNEFTAESFLINLENNSKCKIGTYTFRINPRDAETIDENIIEAFKAVGGISESKE